MAVQQQGMHTRQQAPAHDVGRPKLGVHWVGIRAPHGGLHVISAPDALRVYAVPAHVCCEQAVRPACARGTQLTEVEVTAYVTHLAPHPRQDTPSGQHKPLWTLFHCYLSHNRARQPENTQGQHKWIGTSNLKT